MDLLLYQLLELVLLLFIIILNYRVRASLPLYEHGAIHLAAPVLSFLYNILKFIDIKFLVFPDVVHNGCHDNKKKVW